MHPFYLFIHSLFSNRPDETLYLQASCGGSEQHPFTLVLTVSGSVLSTGSGENGKLGIGNKWSQSTLSLIGRLSSFLVILLTQLILIFSTVSLQKYSRGFDIGLFAMLTKLLRTDKSCFGGSKVESVSAGIDHSLALTIDKDVYHWGLISGKSPSQFGLSGGQKLDFSARKYVMLPVQSARAEIVRS